jgi:hypothetical protein
MAPPPAPPYPLPPPPPGPPVAVPPQDCNGQLLDGDPLLDRPMGPQLGWFASVEADIVKPHVKNHLSGFVTTDGFTDHLLLPNASLDWTGSPRVELGYRFPQGFGEVVIAYRSLVSEGDGVVPNFDFVDGSDGALKSRLNVNVVDLDYASHEFSLGPHWDLKWTAGVRLASAYFDSRVVGPFTEQRSSNNFLGAGPHLGLVMDRMMLVRGLGLYGRIEGAALIGDITQHFDESFPIGDNTLAGGAAAADMTQVVPVVNLQLGISYVSPWEAPWLRFFFGYELENWWYLGKVGDSRAELMIQGAFFRVEWSF